MVVVDEVHLSGWSVSAGMAAGNIELELSSPLVLGGEDGWEERCREQRGECDAKLRHGLYRAKELAICRLDSTARWTSGARVVAVHGDVAAVRGMGVVAAMRCGGEWVVGAAVG